jgi:hypothetical protein
VVNAWKPILAAVVIFAAGVVTGGFVVDFGAPKSLRAFPRERGPRNAERGPGSQMEGQLNWLMKRIQRDLKLTDKQAATVESAFKASREEMKLTFEELRPRMRASTEKLKESLRDDLTEEQIAKFEKYLRPVAMRERFNGGPGFHNRKNSDNRPRRPGPRGDHGPLPEHLPGPPSP